MPEQQQQQKPPVPALHQKIFARAIATDKETGINWTAFGLVDAGILLLSDASSENAEDDGTIQAQLVEYAGNGAALFFTLNAEERSAMQMSDAVYQELNVGLKISERDMAERAKAKGTGGQAGTRATNTQQPRSGGQGNRR